MVSRKPVLPMARPVFYVLQDANGNSVAVWRRRGNKKCFLTDVKNKKFSHKKTKCDENTRKRKTSKWKIVKNDGNIAKNLDIFPLS